MRLQKGSLVLKNLVTERSSVLDGTINRVIEQMARQMPDSEEYSKLLTSLERLITLRNEEPRNRISMDTLVIVTANILGILIIVGYEQGHVVASRGLGLLLRTKHQ